MFPPSQVELIFADPNEDLFPPAHMRSIVDKVARFVAASKPRLEKFIAMNRGMRNYKFIMDAEHPYHAYYQDRLFHFRAQNGSNQITTRKPSPTDRNAAIIELLLKKVDSHDEIYAVMDIVVVSPLTGELVTFNDLSGHIQDPKYKEQKERLFDKIREATLAQDDNILESIIEVAQACPDCFATTEEEVCNAVKAVIEATKNVSDPDWLIPKRRRLDDSLLVPENEFLSQHPGPACISVWVLGKGKSLQISVDSLSDSVISLKEKIAGQIEEAPPANKLKLKLKLGGKPRYFEDSLSLAYYNIAGGDGFSSLVVTTESSSKD